jgi:uncharacterized alpha-E superfamily protein
MLSRVADALYWMGRYIERGENVTRLLLVTDDFATEAMGLDERLAESAWKDLFVIFPAAQVATVSAFAPLALPYLRDFFAFAKNPYAVSYSIRRARENARAVREALTLEVFVALNETHRTLEAWERKPPPDVPGLRDALTSTHRGLFSIVGTIEHTLPRDEGWFFLRLGETLERLHRAAFVLRAKLPGLLIAPAASDVPLYQAQWRTLLRGLASLEHFRRIHGASLEPEQAVPFVLLDPQSPRSLRYGAEALQTHLEAIVGPHDDTLAARLIGRLAADLRYADRRLLEPNELPAFLDHVATEAGKIHDALEARFFVT